MLILRHIFFVANNATSTVDRFAPLEAALEEASRLALVEAKKFEKVDPQSAIAKMKEYKSYQAELSVLKSTRSTNGEPASFR